MITKKEKWKQQQRTFKTTQHVFNKKIVSWMYCSGCGLVALNNEATRKRMQKPCVSMED
jgi:hypothetical protein